MKMVHLPALQSAALVCASVLLFACGKTPAPPQPVIAVPVVAKEWNKHGGTDAEQRFSVLKQITPENIDQLGLAWAFDLGVSRGIEATPLVVDGVIYVTATWNKVFALDARSGELLWHCLLYTSDAADE